MAGLMVEECDWAAAAQVMGMQEELEALQPKLVVSAKETEELMKVIDKETEAANEQRKLVEVEETEAQKQADEAQVSFGHSPSSFFARALAPSLAAGFTRFLGF